MHVINCRSIRGIFQDCRLLNKSDIVQVKQPSGGGLPHRVPDIVQATPRHVPMGFLFSKSNPGNISSTHFRKKLISIAPENSRIHAIVGRCSSDNSTPPPMEHLEYHVFTLSGKTVSSRRLPPIARKAGVYTDDGSKNHPEYSTTVLAYPSEVSLYSMIILHSSKFLLTNSFYELSV